MDKNDTPRHKRALIITVKFREKEGSLQFELEMFLVAMRYIHKSNNPQASNLNMKLNMNCS